MWNEEVVLWQESDHVWNEFGIKTEAPDEDDDFLYAKGIVIWRKLSFGELVERILTAFDATNSFVEDKNILSGIALAITTVNLFPLHLKMIKEDKIANQFLSLIKKKDGEHYLLKKEIKECDFGSLDSFNELISYFVDKSLLNEKDNRFVVNGRVLNGAHLQDN
ncbi:hypothetical protein [Motiliproteus sp. MSK22-1]|uniref:hypothetical protein n=1 Tax=Motiliproteus sp. MSK22-1 TaxID=1897630 RepID=UPI000976BF94|nr:hypothetical protein [Motiliproteus sp. MSK22-1]OMH28077.1 hypothetical protein BGP75_22180 [Motiliproteus sp. MSK22-1]